MFDLMSTLPPFVVAVRHRHYIAYALRTRVARGAGAARAALEARHV